MSLLAAAIAIPLASSSAVAGVYLESTSTDETKATPKVSRTWFDGGRMRMESGDGSAAIFKDRTMYNLDTSTKTYRVIDKATVDRLGGRMADARKQMEEKMATMTPEQRAMVEKMMGRAGGGMPGGAAAAPKRVLKNTGRTEKAGGISCTVWEATVDGKKEEELCAAKSGSFPGGDEVMNTLKEVGEMLKGFTEQMGKMSRNNATQPWRDLQTMNGIPIIQRDFETGKVTSETRLTAARKESVPGAQFEVPAGYTEKKMPGFAAGAPAE
jgi:hypothetical protein